MSNTLDCPMIYFSSNHKTKEVNLNPLRLSMACQKFCFAKIPGYFVMVPNIIMRKFSLNGVELNSVQICSFSRLFNSSRNISVNNDAYTMSFKFNANFTSSGTALFI